MARIEDFCRDLSDEDWESLSAEMNRIDQSKDAEAAKAFADKYGFQYKSLRSYETQHYIEVKKRERIIENETHELRYRVAELEKELAAALHSDTAISIIPATRMMKGRSAKATFYATEDALELFSNVVDHVSEEYGFKKYLAAAFVLEESLKCFSGLFNKDGEQK